MENTDIQRPPRIKKPTDRRNVRPKIWARDKTAEHAALVKVSSQYASR
jgi:hypothetical protein